MIKIINDKGFVVRPEYYTQEQWCQMYLTVIRIYKNLYEEHEQLKTTNESLTSLVNSCQKEIRKYKETIEEARGLIKEEGCYDEETKTFCDDINYDVLPKLLQILDKVKENK